MRGAEATLGILALASLSMAGCTEPGEPAGFAIGTSEQAGAIRGTVVNDEQLPVTGARVELVDAGRFTVTNTSGRFEFLNLDAGRYQVEARIGDNPPVRQTAEVGVGQIVDLLLLVEIERRVEQVPYRLTTAVKGYMTCNVNGDPCPSYPQENSRQRFLHPFEGTPASFLFEMAWERFGPPPPPCLTQDVPNAGCPTDDGSQPGWIHRWELKGTLGVKSAFAVGGPPYQRAPFPNPRAPGVEPVIDVLVRSYPQGFLTLPGVAHEQPFDVYMTTFYVDDLSSTYCAAPPDRCPPPA